MSNHINSLPIPNIPTKYSALPKFVFEKILQGTANMNDDEDGVENLTASPSAESQKKYPCPPSIDDILNRNTYDPPTFLDDLIASANAQAKGQWRDGVKRYIEAGGWILISSNGKKVHYQIKPTELQDYSTGVYLNDQEVEKYVGDYLKKGWVIVAEFHTHPDSGNTTDEPDAILADNRQLPGFIISSNGETFRYGSCKKGIYGIGIPKGCK